jgi:hypothetical protein
MAEPTDNTDAGYENSRRKAEESFLLALPGAGQHAVFFGIIQTRYSQRAKKPKRPWLLAALLEKKNAGVG